MMLEALRPWIVLTLGLWALSLITLAAWRAPKATTRAFDCLGMILIAVLFPAVLVPVAAFFGVLHYVGMSREFYGDIFPRAWRRRR